MSRQFSYHTGAVTEEHVASEKLKSSPTTQLVSQIVLSDGRTISYEYDAEERITKVTDSVDGVTEYTYDALGQLLTETVNGAVINTMTYDGYGNIKSKNGVAYTYGDAVWKDLLTKVGDQSITYDAQGNPTHYLGHTLTWEKGRQLKSFDGNTYTYNANGIRTGKTVDGVKHIYTLDGTKILRETWNGNTLISLYDNEDSVCGTIYNDVPYYFQKNLQGDVIGIVDKDANVVAAYTYDAWGVCTVTQDTSRCAIANINPYRYRGYYYDAEIGMYYLQSRYFNPSVGRFVNADAPKCIGISINPISSNLCAYCQNDCVNVLDEFGFGAIDSLVSALSSALDVISNILNMFANSYYREKKSLENSVKLLTKKQRNRLNDIRSLNKEVNRVCKYLKWVGYALLFVSLVVILGTAYRTGASMDRAIVDCIAETIVNFVVQGAGDLFNRIARFIPYIGFLIGLIGGWLLSYALGKLFNSKKVQRVKNKFANSVRNVRTGLWNWLKAGMASLTA